MKQGRSGFNLFVAIFFVMLVLGASPPSVHAQDNPNTITFDNKSGEPALVKLIGPTGQTVEVPNGESQTVNTGAGEYYISPVMVANLEGLNMPKVIHLL